MKHIFVLDENIVISAATLQNPGGQRDQSAAQLLTLIIRNCHSMASDADTYGRWSRQLDLLQTQGLVVAPTVFRLLASVSWNAEKWAFQGNTPELTEEKGWSSKLQDDAPFIRLAAHCHGVLVANDPKLLEDVVSLDLHNKFEFGVADLPQALGLASEAAS